MAPARSVNTLLAQWRKLTSCGVKSCSWVLTICPAADRQQRLRTKFHRACIVACLLHGRRPPHHVVFVARRVTYHFREARLRCQLRLPPSIAAACRILVWVRLICMMALYSQLPHTAHSCCKCRNRSSVILWAVPSPHPTGCKDIAKSSLLQRHVLIGYSDGSL
jgi:hypothetical protein